MIALFDTSKLQHCLKKENKEGKRGVQTRGIGMIRLLWHKPRLGKVCCTGQLAFDHSTE